MLRGEVGPVATAALAEGAAGLARFRPGGRAAGAADAGADRRVGRGRARAGRRRPRSSGSSTASGCRSTAAATTPRTCRCSPGRWTTSPAGCPSWSRPRSPCRSRSVVLDGEAIALHDGRSAAAVPADRQPDRVPRRRRQRAGADAADAVRVRRAARRRRGPADGAGRRAARGGAGRGRAGRAAGAAAGHRRRRRRGGRVPRRRDRARARGRGREVAGRPVRRRPARRRVAQGQAGAHPRPGRARRRVGPRAPARAGCRTCTWAPATPDRGLRDAGQDLQGPHRRDAARADRAAARARGVTQPVAGLRAARAASSRSPSTACRHRRAIPAVSRCGSPVSCATAPTSAPTRRTPSTTVRALHAG